MLPWVFLIVTGILPPASLSAPKPNCALTLIKSKRSLCDDVSTAKFIFVAEVEGSMPGSTPDGSGMAKLKFLEVP